MLISQLCAPEPTDSTATADSEDSASNIVVPRVTDYMLQRQRQNSSHYENRSRRNSLLNTGLSPVSHTTDADDVSSSGSLRTVVEEDTESSWSQSPPFERKGRSLGTSERMPRRSSDVVTWGSGGCDTFSDPGGHFGRNVSCLSEGCDPNTPVMLNGIQPPEPAKSAISLKRTTNDSTDEDDGSREDGNGKKARLSNSTAPYVSEFACPFYKRNRRFYYKQRSCRSSGWPSVHRVKEHLYRHHMHSVCERCSSTFKDQSELREHLRQDVSCQVCPRNVPEDAGFDQEVEKKLRSRKKIDGQKEEDKWVHMYRLLFPSFQNKPTPSPYVDCDPRDEPPVHLAKLQSYDQPAVVHPESDPRNPIAMVAAAAERRIAAAENCNGGFVSPGSHNTGGPFAPLPRPTNGRFSIAEVTSASSVDSTTELRRMIAEEVRAAMSGQPSPTISLSP